MYKSIKLRHNILGILDEKMQYMLEFDMYEVTHRNIWMSWGVIFEGLGVQKDG